MNKYKLIIETEGRGFKTWFNESVLEEITQRVLHDYYTGVWSVDELDIAKTGIFEFVNVFKRECRMRWNTIAWDLAKHGIAIPRFTAMPPELIIDEDSIVILFEIR